MSDITNRLLTRAKKAEERAREVKHKPQQRPAPVPKKELSIPKKESVAHATTSSLLAGMAVPPPTSTTGSTTHIHPPTTADKPRREGSVPSSPGISRPNPNHTTTTTTSVAPSMNNITTTMMNTRGNETTLTRPSSIVDMTGIRSGSNTPPPQLLPSQASEVVSAQSAPIQVESKKKALQGRVWDSLAELCRKMDTLENHPFRLGPASVGPTVDLSISFLKSKENDWFDLDAEGNIVLQPKVPIFPEDFPPGMPEWPLSWWGIVDPAVGERREKLAHDEQEDDEVQVVEVPVRSTKEDRPPSRDRSSRRSRSRDRGSKRRSSSRDREYRRNRRDSPDSLERRPRSSHHRREDRGALNANRRGDSRPPKGDGPRALDDRPPYSLDRRPDERPRFPGDHRGVDNRPPHADDRRRDEDPPKDRRDTRPPYHTDRRGDHRPAYPDNRRRHEEPPPHPKDRRGENRGPPHPDDPRPFDDHHANNKKQPTNSPPRRYGRHIEEPWPREDRRDRRHSQDRRGRRPDDY